MYLTIRTITHDTEIANEYGFCYDCTIYYELEEETNIVRSYGVAFHYGYSNPKDGFKYVPEIVQEIIESLEGHKLDFQCECIIE